MIVTNKDNTLAGKYEGFRTYLLIGETNTGTKGISIQMTEVDANGEQFIHFHAPEQCYYIVEGKGLMTVGGERREVSAGDAIYVPSNAVHGIRNIGNDTLIYLTANSPSFGRITESRNWPLLPQETA
jgi:quercetin dioxygenase-like cupin family protein